MFWFGHGLPVDYGVATTIVNAGGGGGGVVVQVCSAHQPGHFAIVIRASAYSLRVVHRRNPPLN